MVAFVLWCPFEYNDYES